MSNLKIEATDGKIIMSGFIDETAVFDSVLSAKGNLTLNMKDVTRVNSCGVREWVDFIAKLSDATLTYEECPIVVVKQLNAVPESQGKAIVKSFYAPYFCEECDQEATRLIDRSQVNGDLVPEMKCESCQNPMNFDAIAGQYFAFMKR